MTAVPAADDLLPADQQARLRKAITEAVLSHPADLRERLEREPEASLVLVAATRTAAEQTSLLLREAVASARSAGHSWDVVGRLLGVSRQAAQQRSGPAPVAPLGAGSAERRVLSPLTAFTEMAVLEREGGPAGTSSTTGPSSTSWRPRTSRGSTAASRGRRQQRDARRRTAGR